MVLYTTAVNCLRKGLDWLLLRCGRAMSGEVKAKEFIDIDDYADVTTELTKEDIVSSISRGPANAEGYAG